ncbi:MAG: hypothetical protein GX791_05765, partial [Synergistaceae bacterium]|nr:hypothetical protein [Synergistaceae bacterium]
NYTTPASEDTWFPLNTNGFAFKTPWTNQDADGSEKTFALLTPVIIGGSESANGSQFSYYDGTVTHYLTYLTGSPVAIPMEYLDTVQFIAAPNVAGSFEIQVQAKTVDTDPDTSEVVTAISGNAVLTNLVVEPVADVVTLAVSSPSRGNEDTAIPLSIRPSSSDLSETFRVTISGIPEGSVLTYKGDVLDTSSGSVVISDFVQSAPLTILPPFNSNVDFNLNVSVVSVDTFGGITDISEAQSLPLAVYVQGVADSANVITASPLFTEAEVDDNGHNILLSNFITGASLTDTDGSETLSLTLTGLDPKFSISGGTFVGGTGTGRQWIICSGELANCKVTVPPNFSGTVDFDVRAVTTENDGNSLTGLPVSVSGTITPSPEAAMVTSTVALEDTLTKLNFDTQHKNGDMDEEITSVSIKISDVEGKGFSLFLGETGTTLATAAGEAGSGVTIDGVFYKISGTALDNIWAKGDPNSSGEHTFGIRYEVTDPSSDGTLPAVASTTDGTYTLTVNPVTDDTTTTLTNLVAGNGNAVISGSTVTASGTTSISMDVIVQQVADPKAGGTPDTDGSEKLVRFVIDGVPDGVTVQGGVYIGDTPGNPNTGQWLVNISGDSAFSGSDSLVQTIVFELNGTSNFLSNLNETIIIRAVSQDTGSTVEVISNASFTLTTPENFDASAPSIAVPAEIAEANFTPLSPENGIEDGGMNLNSLVDFTLIGSSPFSITLTGIPAGAQVSGMTLTMVNGEEIWTASGAGADGTLQDLLSGITITPPENWNDNNHPGGLIFEAKLTTYTPSGEQNTAQVDVIQPITPVSDPTEITIAAPAGIEDSNVNLTISVGNDADGEFNTIVEGKLYISLNQAAMDSSGKLYYGGSEVFLQEVSGVSGISDGNYYVLAGVSSGNSFSLTYEPAPNASGAVSLTAELVSQETGASNALSAEETVTFSVLPVNDGAIVSALTPATGAEDTKIQLNLEANLIDTDGSESILSAILGNVPDGYLVFAGGDAASAALATNLGGDGSENSWAIGLTGGALPAYVAILPPEHFSGTVKNLSFSVISGEEGLDPEVDTANFNLTITPVADGITLNPTLSFGTEGQGVHLNLNSSMLDTDGSETVTLTLKGLGDHAAFSAGSGSAFTTLYNADTDTYTLSGIEHDHIDKLSVIQTAGTYSNVQVEAWTIDGSDESNHVSDTFKLDIAEKIPTAEDDILLYKTGGSFDGREGIDTLLLRPGEDIDFATDPLIRNMEIIDLDNTGANHVISNLTVQDVLNITDENNDLKILGNSWDTVNLLNDGTGTWQHTGTVIEGAITFDVYASVLNSDITVKIQEEINDNLV